MLVGGVLGEGQLGSLEGVVPWGLQATTETVLLRDSANGS